MKKFTIPCDFGGARSMFEVYLGDATPGMHPLHYQGAWLKENRGGVVERPIWESFGILRRIADQNAVSFEDLCVNTLNAARDDANRGAPEEGRKSDSGDPVA